MRVTLSAWRAAALIGMLSVVILCGTALLVLVPTEAGFETLGEAATHAIAARQNPDGSFPSFEGATQGFAAYTGEALLALYVLDSLSRIDLSNAVDFIVSRQNASTGGFSEGSHPTELYTPAARVAPALAAVGALDEINKTLLVKFVLDHYNGTEGGFFEPDGMCYFFLILHTLEPLYARSNIISTYLGVSLLARLNALSAINVTRTLAFAASCRGPNGGFRPFPNATVDGQPVFFPTDSQGIGLPYTYCAVKTLEVLGRLNDTTLINSTQTSRYVWSCQGDEGGFWLTPGSDPWHSWPYDDASMMYTYYAFETLHALDSLPKTDKNTGRAIEWILSWQWLEFWRSLTPNPALPEAGFESPCFLARSDWYGVFWGMHRTPITITFMAVHCLSIVDGLVRLQAPTARSLLAWQFVVAAAICGGIVTGGSVAAAALRASRQAAAIAAFVYFAALMFALFVLNWIELLLFGTAQARGWLSVRPLVV